MADLDNNSVVAEENTVVEENKVENEPTIEELKQLLADKDKEYAKLKLNFDKTASDLSNKKKELREKMTADEKASELQADNARKLAIYEAMENYATLYPSMDNATAKKLAELDADNDKVGAAEVMKEFIDALVKQKSAEALLGRQKVNASTGAVNQMTKEQFENLDLVEKTKLRRENLAEYNRLKQ